MSKTVDMTRWNSIVDKIASRLIEQGEEAVSKLDKVMAIDFEEHFEFQNLKSEAFIAGRIDQDVAQAIYMALGENHAANRKNGGWTDQVDTAEKVAITQIMGELLSLKIKNLMTVA